MLQKLTQGLNEIRIQSSKNNEFVKLQFTNKDSETVLTVGKKEFNHSNHQDVFLSPTDYWVKCCLSQGILFITNQIFS